MSERRACNGTGRAPTGGWTRAIGRRDEGPGCRPVPDHPGSGPRAPAHESRPTGHAHATRHLTNPEAISDGIRVARNIEQPGLRAGIRRPYPWVPWCYVLTISPWMRLTRGGDSQDATSRRSGVMASRPGVHSRLRNSRGGDVAWGPIPALDLWIRQHPWIFSKQPPQGFVQDRHGPVRSCSDKPRTRLMVFFVAPTVRGR